MSVLGLVTAWCMKSAVTDGGFGKWAGGGMFSCAAQEQKFLDESLQTSIC